MSSKVGNSMFINWVRLGIGGFLTFLWVHANVSIDFFDNTDRIVWTLVFCFSLLIIGLAFERKNSR